VVLVKSPVLVKWVASRKLGRQVLVGWQVELDSVEEQGLEVAVVVVVIVTAVEWVELDSVEE
jgi:hypothetical protein